MICRHNIAKFKRDYLGACAISLAAAGFFTIFFEAESLPGIGHAPLLATVFFAACLGFPFLMAAQKLGPVDPRNTHLTIGTALKLMALGLALAIPPVAIDIFAPFPRDMNVQLPAAFLFYPAIALVADVFSTCCLSRCSSACRRETRRCSGYFCQPSFSSRSCKHFGCRRKGVSRGWYLEVSV